jgi:hypothetical protein
MIAELSDFIQSFITLVRLPLTIFPTLLPSLYQLLISFNTNTELN